LTRKLTIVRLAFNLRGAHSRLTDGTVCEVDHTQHVGGWVDGGHCITAHAVGDKHVHHTRIHLKTETQNNVQSMVASKYTIE